MVARVVPQSARRRHAESRKPDLWGRAARPKAPVLALLRLDAKQFATTMGVGIGGVIV